MVLTRKLTIQEERLVDFLVQKSTLVIPSNWKDGLLASSMEDGGMGSLRLFPYGEIYANREFGQQVSECQFTDTDGVTVIASLYVDVAGDLLELDIWKTDFSRLLEMPF